MSSSSRSFDDTSEEDEFSEKEEFEINREIIDNLVDTISEVLKEIIHNDILKNNQNEGKRLVSQKIKLL